MTEPTAAEIAAIVDDAAAAPQSGSVTPAGSSYSERPLPDLLEYERVRSGQAAQRAGALGIKFFKTKPPGAV